MDTLLFWKAWYWYLPWNLFSSKDRRVCYTLCLNTLNWYTRYDSPVSPEGVLNRNYITSFYVLCLSLTHCGSVAWTQSSHILVGIVLFLCSSSIIFLSFQVTFENHLLFWVHATFELNILFKWGVVVKYAHKHQV